MHCIVIGAAEGSVAWDVHLSAELLAYKRNEQRVSILFMLFLERKSAGEGWIRILHRGNVRCRLADPWPLPPHTAEPISAGESLLMRTYGRAFYRRGDGLVWKNGLTCWDAWDGLKPERSVCPWPSRDGAVPVTDDEGWLIPEQPVPTVDQHVPFTTWRFGPFAAQGLYLMAFHLEFCGESFRHLLEDVPPFSVDGPNRLLDEIRRADLSGTSRSERDNLEARLADFTSDTKRLQCRKYDVVVLEQPCDADQVETDDEYLPDDIVEAPMQPPEGGGKRFLTTSQAFYLPLRFAASRDMATASDRRTAQH